MSMNSNPSSNSFQNINKSTMSSETGETSTGYHDRHAQQGDSGSASADSSGSRDASPSEGTANATPRSLSTTSGDKPGDSRMVVDDPFDNKKRQILFNAIDRLQACGSHKYLAIPQVCLDYHAILKRYKLIIPSSSSWGNSLLGNHLCSER